MPTKYEDELFTRFMKFFIPLSILLVIGAACLLHYAPAKADMFVWINSSGNTEMWGCPPSWYRNGSAKHAPRTQYYANGQLVDDTATQLPGNEAARLRSIAIGRCAPVSNTQGTAVEASRADVIKATGESSTVRSTDDVKHDIEQRIQLPNTPGVGIKRPK